MSPSDSPSRGSVAASTGILSSVRGLFTPDHFVSRAPAATALAYAQRRGGIEPLADVYLPDGPGPHPSVVLVHGGGFLIGSRSMKPMRLLATRLCEAGVAAMTFDYRMVFRGGRIDEIVHDVAAAARWWRQQEGRFGLDPARVAMMGLSAGSSLTMLAAARLAPEEVERLVCVFGVTDFSALRGHRADLLRRLLLGTGDPARWRERSPIEASSRVAQPVLLIHGTDDTLVPVEHSEWLADHRKALGLPVQAVYIDGAPHAFFNEPRYASATEQALAAILGFLGRT